MRYDRLTRWLHALMASGVAFQLLLSLVLEAPNERHKTPLSGLPLLIFKTHENVGVALMALLVLHWLWSLSGHVQGGVGHLFPWFSGARISEVVGEAKELLKFHLPNPAIDNALAGATHGLGLLVATGMAGSGTVIFFNLSESGHMTSLGKVFAEVHGSLATFMWIYLIGHVATAVLHKWQGHDSIKEIFTLFK
jgi:cytochrome b561